MDLSEEIKIIFDELKNAFPKSKKTEMLLEDSYDKILSIISKKNKNIYKDIVFQMKQVPLTKLLEKSS